MTKTQDVQMEFDEVYSALGVTLARKGRFIYFEASRSPEERTKVIENFRELQSSLPSEFEHRVQQLEVILSQYNPLDVIANIALVNLIIDPENYKEYEHDGNPAFAEYVALLYLTKPYQTYPDRNEDPIPGETLEAIQTEIRDLFRNHLIYFRIKDIDFSKDIERDSLSVLRSRTLSESLIVRFPAYRHHLIELLSDLFSPFESELVRTIGFSFSDVLAIANTISALMDDRLYNKRVEATKLEKQLRKAVKIFRQKGKVVGNFTRDLLEHLVKLKPSESSARVRNSGVAWLFHNIGELISFHADELATITSIERSHVISYLTTFSIRFGEVDARYRLPAPTHPLSTRPIIDHDNRYFCPVPAQLYYGSRENIETILKTDLKRSDEKNALWQRYERHRAKYLETKALEYLRNALKHADVYNDLTYQVYEDGQDKEVQLDGLIVLDSAVLLIEAKAGMLSPSARRGAQIGMKNDLARLIAEAYSQAQRAKQYIKESNIPTFYLRNGTKVTIDTKEIDRIYLVTISLDNLDPFIATIYELDGFGFFSENEYPWAVSLTDLRVITELIEFPSQLINYLDRRVRLNRQGFAHAHDELDWFGHYLREGLYFDDPDINKSTQQVELLSYTTEMDEYYFYLMGDRVRPAAKPIQSMPNLLHQILEELEEVHPQGYLRASCALLDMNSEDRDHFVRHYELLKKLTLKDRQFHDFTIIYTDLGITCMFASSEYFAGLKKRLAGYCNMKKYQTRCNKWIGIGCIVDAAGLVHGLHIIDALWQYDETMNRLVEENLIPLDGKDAK